jgi:hypothetical protein
MGSRVREDFAQEVSGLIFLIENLVKIDETGEVVALIVLNGKMQ